MKYQVMAAVLAFGLAAGSPAAALAAPVTELSVSGTGSVALPPDVATVNAVIETNAANASQAVSQNNARYDRVVAALEHLGIARDDVTLSSYNVSFNPKPQTMPPVPTGERYGYTVTREFAVKVRQIGKAGSVADACTSSGSTGINGVDFGLADPGAARAQAIAKAVADARATAQALAQAANLHLVSIQRIELGGNGPILPQPMMRMAASTVAPPTQFDQANVNVTVSITAVFTAAP